MDIKKQFGKKVKEKRLGLELTQEALAEKIGISAKSLSQIELGNNFVSADNLEAICKALQVNPKVLFDFEETENYDEFFNKVKHNQNLLNKIAKIAEIID